VNGTTFTVVDGLRTRLRIHGEGTPLLLMGGVWSQVELWDDVLPHLTGFRAIAFDPPGIGATDLPARPLTVGGLARFAGGVLDAVGVHRAHVLGVSLGGLVAQQLAHSLPNRVDRLALVSTGFGAPGIPGRPDVVLRFVRPRAYADLDELERSAGRIFGGRLRAEPGLVHRWHLRPAPDLRSYLYRLVGTAGFSSLPWLHRLPHHTLVVHGDDDPIVPLINARTVACRVPHATLRVVHGGGHLMVLDSAAEVLPIVTDFLSRPSR
jgi:pimeloyl-ACP methyl ester carboxylesterase